MKVVYRDLSIIYEFKLSTCRLKLQVILIMYGINLKVISMTSGGV